MHRANGSTEEYFGLETEATCEFQINPAPTELASFEKETSVISSYEYRELSDACSTGTPARRCSRRARVPVLQVTAPSDAVSYTFLLPMKFQVSCPFLETTISSRAEWGGSGSDRFVSPPDCR